MFVLSGQVTVAAKTWGPADQFQFALLANPACPASASLCVLYPSEVCMSLELSHTGSSPVSPQQRHKLPSCLNSQPATLVEQPWTAPRRVACRHPLAAPGAAQSLGQRRKQKQTRYVGHPRTCGTTSAASASAACCVTPHSNISVQMFVIKNLDTGTQMRIDDFDRLAHIATDPDPAEQVGRGPPQHSHLLQQQQHLGTHSTVTSLQSATPTSANCCVMCCPHVPRRRIQHTRRAVL
jgi:hypothetical protein